MGSRTNEDLERENAELRARVALQDKLLEKLIMWEPVPSPSPSPYQPAPQIIPSHPLLPIPWKPWDGAGFTLTGEAQLNNLALTGCAPSVACAGAVPSYSVIQAIQ
jgi:hypothetical protein